MLGKEALNAEPSTPLATGASGRAGMSRRVCLRSGAREETEATMRTLLTEPARQIGRWINSLAYCLFLRFKFSAVSLDTTVILFHTLDATP
jgi:hypothetical protein